MSTPLTAEQVRERLVSLREHDLPTHGGRTLAYVYDSGRAEVDLVAREALAAYGGSNGLDPTAFPSLAAMEREVVGFAAGLLDAPAGYAGTVTSGGTESCLLAVLAARDARPEVARPRIVAPTTIHAAFHKAAHLFGLELTLVDVDPATYRADPAAMAAALTDRTVLVAASAPSYAHGVVDPIEEIAAVAAERGIRCHVDACIGGFVLPFLDAPPWSFVVPGVTSVSADLHKYGYAPKGASLLLHRSMALRHTQFWATADWPGYGVVNSTLQSTKSGGPLAAAWATVSMLGRQGMPPWPLRRARRPWRSRRASTAYLGCAYWWRPTRRCSRWRPMTRAMSTRSPTSCWRGVVRPAAAALSGWAGEPASDRVGGDRARRRGCPGGAAGGDCGGAGGRAGRGRPRHRRCARLTRPSGSRRCNPRRAARRGRAGRR